MLPWFQKKEMNQLRNEIGHIGYLNSQFREQQKIQSGINSAMLQNLLPVNLKEFDLWDFEFKVFSQHFNALLLLSVEPSNCQV